MYYNVIMVVNTQNNNNKGPTHDEYMLVFGLVVAVLAMESPHGVLRVRLHVALTVFLKRLAIREETIAEFAHKRHAFVDWGCQRESFIL